MSCQVWMAMSNNTYISCNFYDKALLNMGADGAVGYIGGGAEHEKDADKHPVPWAKIEHTLFNRDCPRSRSETKAAFVVFSMRVYSLM